VRKSGEAFDTSLLDSTRFSFFVVGSSASSAHGSTTNVFGALGGRRTPVAFTHEWLAVGETLSFVREERTV
jgi:hypothetical protein